MELETAGVVKIQVGFVESFLPRKTRVFPAGFFFSGHFF